jgi:hypothetical protein
MRSLSNKLTKYAANRVATLVVALLAGIAGVSYANADEAQAKELLKGMSDYLGKQNAVSFDYDSSLEVVTREGQKLSFASSGMVALNRPDKIKATRRGGFANIEMVFDGKTLSLLGKDANLYAQAEVPGDIDHLVEELRNTYHRPVPAADLLMADFYDQIMPLVVDVKDLGSGVIGGTECDHLAFRTEEADFQIWIAQGSDPYPCRYEITSAKVKGFPQYAIDVRNWKTGGEAAVDDFKFNAPVGATEIKPNEMPNLDELPDEYRPEGAE